VAYSCFPVRREVPDAIRQRLNRLIMDALYEPAVLARVREFGLTPPPRDWDIGKCDAFVRRECDSWTKFIEVAKIEAQQAQQDVPPRAVRGEEPRT
jgi:hypothetical protein